MIGRIADVSNYTNSKDLTQQPSLYVSSRKGENGRGPSHSYPDTHFAHNVGDTNFRLLHKSKQRHILLTSKRFAMNSVPFESPSKALSNGTEFVGNRLDVSKI